MKEIPDGSVDMILADPPYGKTANKWDSVIDIDSMFDQYKRIIKDNGAIVVFSQMPFGAEIIVKNHKLFRYEWIWDKVSSQGFLNCNKMPLRRHENILVFYKKLPTYNPQKWQSHSYIKKAKGGLLSQCIETNYGTVTGDTARSLDGLRFPIDIIQFKKDHCIGSNEERMNKCIHPTQKPVVLLEYLIKTYTNPGELVLDNCMGSGSTCVAAKNTGRRYIGFELDTEYFEIAKNRISCA